MQKSIYRLNRIRDTFFYGNFFAGMCAVALTIETNAQHHKPSNGLHFYSLIFVGTAFFYTYTYLKNLPQQAFNDREAFYLQYQQFLKKTQPVLLFFLLADALFFIGKYYTSFVELNKIKIGQLLIFPIIAAVYTFNILPFPNLKKLRRIGWLKPFAIGFVWSGFVTVYPILFYQIQQGASNFFFSMPSGWLFIQNFMFISTLCIIFDLKDYAADKQEGLKTFAVQFGVQNTIRFIIVPLALAGIVAFFMFAQKKQLNNTAITLNLVPYILLLISAYTLLKKQRSISYYLIFIDGLMLIKAICGYIAVHYVS